MKVKRMSFGAAGAMFALLSLMLFVAACGGDGDEGDRTHTDPTDTVPVAGEPTATEPSEPDPTAAEPAAPVETSLDVTLLEFAVEPSVDSIPVGTVTFNISNNGVLPHNFRVIATDLAPDALPVDDSLFMADEAQVDVLASGDDLSPGQIEDVSVDLEAGSYVLICNVPTHYGAGMKVAFTVG